jgi:hypothetical protein
MQRARVNGAAAVLVAILACACVGSLAGACSCGKTSAGASNVAPGSGSTPAVNRLVAPAEAGPVAIRDVAMWASARTGSAEDLASLATHEGAAGLVEATNEPELRMTALRAMGYARGWAQLPFLARSAAGENEDEAKVALESVVELAARPRRSEDVEDEPELREGCEKLGALARDVARARERRIPAIRALRMMPCPKQELPTDLDTK